MRRLRVVTWNVGRLYTPTSRNKLSWRAIPQVARTLDELDPDAVLLQELTGPAQLAALVDLLPGYAGALAERCRYDRQVAALVRARLEPRFEQHVLEPSGRGLVIASFRAGAVRAAVHPVHLDAFSSQGRRDQAEALRRVQAERAEEVVVVGGDFNLDPEVARVIRQPLDPGTYAGLAEGFLERGREPTLVGLLRVDHVLARGPISRLVTRVAPRRRLPLGDHDPVVADLELVDAAEPSP